MTTISRQPGSDYAAIVTVSAPIESAYAALATVDGLRGWWTTATSGSAEPGGELKFEFPGVVDVPALMRVEESSEPSRVRWTCLKSPLHEWAGTRLTFELTEATPDRTEISFTHAGLQPALECFDTCSAGWDHHLCSLGSYIETGSGQPHGA